MGGLRAGDGRGAQGSGGALTSMTSRSSPARFRIGIDARKLKDYGIGSYIRNLLEAIGRQPEADAYRFRVYARRADAEALPELPDHFEVVYEESPGYSGAELTRFGLQDAEADGTLTAVGSTYSPENNAITDGIGRSGVRLVSFAPILKHRVFPLAELLDTLLEIGRQGTGTEVEIEFAVNLSVPSGERPEFGFLQMRPLAM